MGIFYGLLSAATFGLIPLFTLPLLAAGVSIGTALTYRFGLATLIVGLILYARGEQFRIGWMAFFKICLLALFYMLAVILFFQAFRYLPSGIVATLQFQYPVMVLLIMVFFFHERFRWQTGLAVLLGVAGVALLSLDPGDAPAIDQEAARSSSRVLIGVTLSLIAGLCNGLYFVGIQVARLPRINGLVFTFYVMLFGTLFCVVNGIVTNSLQWLANLPDLANAVMLAMVTAVLSNLTLILAIRLIGSTLSSILGVAEPLTAVCVGVLVFGEPLTLQIIGGVGLILCSVILSLCAKPENKGTGGEKLAQGNKKTSHS